MPKRKPCDRPVPGGHCDYERMAGKQMCRWHWLMRQTPAIQKEAALARREYQLGQDFAQFQARVPQDRWPAGERWCSGCQSFVPLFYCQGSRCRSCNSEASHGARIEKLYGITPEEYAELFKLQDGRCYICRRKTKKRLAVDHNHETGQVRGLLCADSDRGCNHAILGNIRDLAMAKRIVEYLEDPPYERLNRAERHEEQVRKVEKRLGTVGYEPPPF